MLLKEFFENYNKERIIKEFEQYIRELAGENINIHSNKDCLIVNKMVENIYDSKISENVNKTFKKLNIN